MSGALVPIPSAAPPLAALGPPSVDLYAAILGGRPARTVAAYRSDYQDFARFLGLDGPAAALDALTSWSSGQGHAAAIAYRSHLAERGLAAATVSRRLAALRAAVRLARQLGRVDWILDVEGPRARSYRDTRGPGDDGYKAILARAKSAAAASAAGRRDLALIRLMHDLGLRRAEALGLDLVDVEQLGPGGRATVNVRGKGRRDKERLSLPPATAAALGAWLGDRGDWPGPVFVRLDLDGGRIRPGLGRLSGESARKIVAALGRAAGLARPVRPHGLRHQAITRALDVSRGDIRAAQRFSRHASPETLLRYDDNRRDLGGELAAAIAED